MDLSRILTLGFGKKLLRWSAIGLVLYALFGFFALPYILKSVLASQLTRRLHREATIQAVSFNPFRLTLQVKDFALKERNGSAPFVSFAELALNLEAASLWERGPVIREVSLKTLRVAITRNEDFSYNFSDLLTEFAAKPEPPSAPPPSATPLRFSINNIRLEDGGLDFDDRPKHARHTLSDLRFSIPFLSNLPYAIDVYTQPAFAVKVNGTPIELSGRSKPFSDSHETALDVNIDNVELAKYLEYVPADLRFKLNSGSLQTALALSFSQSKDHPPALLANGKIGLKQLAVTDLEGRPLVSLPLLEVPVESLDVFGHRFTLGAILVQAPEVHLQLDKAGVLNFTTLVGEQKAVGTPGASGEPGKSEKAGEAMQENQPQTEPGVATTEKPQEKKQAGAQTEGEKGAANKTVSAPTVVDIAEIRLTEGKVSFVDDSHDQTFQTTLDNLNVSVRQISTDAAKPMTLEVSCKSDAGEALHHTGTVLREPLKAEGSISLQQVKLNRYAPYYAKQILFDIVDGKLDVAAQFSVAKGPDAPPAVLLSGLAATLTALRLHKPGEKDDFLTIPALSVKEAVLDVAKQTVAIGEVTTDKGTLQVRRDSQGALNLASFTPTSSAPSSQAAAPQAKPIAPQPRGKKAAKAAQPQAPPEPVAPAWLVNVKKFTVDQYAVGFEDRTPAQPVTATIAPLSVSLENVSTEKNQKTTAALRATLNKSGMVTVDGPLSLNPLAATFKISSKGLDLLPFRPYFTDKLKILLTSGAVSAEGNLGLQSVDAGNLNVTYTGQAAVTKFATITKADSKDFLKWKSLYVTGVNIGTVPFHVDVGEVALTEYYSRLTINPDATFNVQGLVVEQPSTVQPVASQPLAPTKPSSAGGAASGTAPISIAKVTLQGGTVDFSDHYVKPNYSAKLTRLGGRVTGLTSKTNSQADVDLRGSLDNAAPLEISGRLNPFGKDLFVDLAVDFKDIDLNPMTPYAGKYAGYAIEKGKLTLNLKYQIANRQLKAENKVFIDQFTFGESVSSPTATSLPVKLAVSLLKDRNGAIYLDLPLSGSLDDPQFSVWGTIVQVVTNLLMKAATAPFALIGAVVGGGGSGEEMNRVEFAYGRTTLDESAQEKMKKISEALSERPSLSLEITGYAEKDKDLDGLKLYRFERKLKAQKLNDVGKAEDGASLDEINIKPEEYLKYLTLAYKNESFPKPRNMFGLVKDLPQEEMETLMFAHIEATEEDVQELAGQRAVAVRDYLLKTGQLEAGRLFLVEPASIFATRQGAGKASRVELAMR